MRRSVVSNRVAALSIAILLALVALTINGVIAVTASATETRSLTSSADTRIVENAPINNYSAATSLGVNGNVPSGSGKDKFALVKWDLSEIAPHTQINSALVTLNVTNASPQTYQAYVLKEPWVESEATWNDYSSGEPWEVEGAKGSLDKETTVAGSITPSVMGKNTLTLPPAVVQGWVDNPATNQGIIIANPSSTRGFSFNSREDTDPTQRPQLILDLSPDTTPPETTIDSGPSGTISSREASFTFSSSEAGSTLECSLDSAAYTACTSPKEYTDLSEGSHTFSVKATDAAGNTDASPASTTWTVDTMPPDTKIDSNPNALTNSASASFDFSSTEPGSSFQCKLDSGTYESCTSPKSLTDLSDGSHTFSVKATDEAGNTDPTPADFTWTVDITPPDISITDGPAEGATDTDGNVTFTFSGTDKEAIARYEVKNVKDGVEEPFVSNGLFTTKSFTNLTNGPYSFRVRALDSAGNISTAAIRNYSVSIPASDTTPPDTSIISGPAEGSTDTDGNVSFSFTSTEANSTFECKLNSGTYGSCTSPKDYTNLADGAHTFSVKATDSAGNIDPSPASRNFNVSAPVSRVSVTDFGATAGDNSNDTVAFENAMAAAGPGEVVWVPKGVGAYRVYRVNIPSDTDMDVEAGAVIKFYGTNKGHTFVVRGPTASNFAQNIHIQGVGGSFTLDLSDAAVVPAGGFDIDNVDGFSLKHMNCINNNSNPDTTYPSSRPSCIVPSPANTTQRADGTYNDPRNLVFEDIHGYGGPYGFGLFQFTAGSNVQLTNISGEGGVAVRLENYANWTPIKNITMNGVTCKDGHAAINFNPHGATHQGNIHINNVTANSCESAVSLAGNGTYGPDVSVDGVTAIPGNTAQVRDNDPINAVGAWVIGPSQYCIDDRTNAYTVALSSLLCGGLPNR